MPNIEPGLLGAKRECYPLCYTAPHPSSIVWYGRGLDWQLLLGILMTRQACQYFDVSSTACNKSHICVGLGVTSKSQWARFIEPASLRTSQRALEWFSHFFHRHRCIFLRRDARSIEAHKKRDSLCKRACERVYVCV